MEIAGEFRLRADRDTVWKALNNPELLKRCIPGCVELTKLSDTEMVAQVAAKIGPVNANFKIKVTLSDLDPPHRYTINGEGQGGVAGFARGSARVNLAQETNETVLSYAVRAHVGGKLAQIGSRLVDATARKLATEFFEKLNQAISEARQSADTVVVPAPRLRSVDDAFAVKFFIWSLAYALLGLALLYYSMDL